MANYSKIQEWRDAVKARDGHKCKNCGRTEQLECHHIIPMAQTTAFAFARANGVTLCRECHKETDSYANQKIARLSNGLAIIVSIPHHWQDYPTVGNWIVGPKDDPVVGIFVSEMENKYYEFLVALHELIESALCAHRGVKQSDVDAFDMAFKGDGEPGDDPAAPYHKEHVCATTIESIMAMWLDVDWREYEAAVAAL